MEEGEINHIGIKLGNKDVGEMGVPTPLEKWGEGVVV